MERIWHDVRSGVRSAVRGRGFTLVAVLTLGIGMGASTALFSVIRGVLLRPLPFSEPQRLVALWSSSPRAGIERAPVSVPDLIDWESRATSFQGLAAWRHWGFVIDGDGGAERVRGARQSADLLPLLGVQPVLGRWFLQDEDSPGQHVMLVSEGLWRSRFGADRELIGRQLALDGQAHTVVGVFPVMPLFDAVDVVVPLAFEPFASTQRGSRALAVVGRLRPGATMAQARADIAAIARALESEYPDANAGWTASLRGLQEDIAGNTRVPLLLLSAAVAAILLIACANLANLYLSRTTGRRQEIAIRVALGASRRRVIVQLLAESIVPALLAGALGVFLAVLGTEFLIGLIPRGLPGAVVIRVDFHVLAVALAVSAATGLGFGLGPALQVSRTDPIRSIRAGAAAIVSERDARNARTAIVLLDVALAFILLAGAGLLLRSFVNVRTVDPGFVADDILMLTVSLPDPVYPDGGQRLAFFDALVRRVTSNPAVTGAALASHLPLAPAGLDADFTPADAPVPPSSDGRTARLTAISPDFFSVMRVPLLAGRVFTYADNAAASPVIIISDNLARRLRQDGNVIGQRLHVGATSGADPRPREIVGVVANVRADRLEAGGGPAIYVPYAQNPWPTMTLLVQSAGDPLRLATPLRDHVREIDSRVPVYNLRSLDAFVAGTWSTRRSLLFLAGALAAVALVLAAIGVYAVTAHAVGQRTAELGLRSALGAQRADLLRLVVGNSLRVIAFGVTIGCAAALATGLVLRPMLFGVSPWDPGTFATVALFLLAVGLVASSVPARRAARIDPAAALRRN